MGAGGALGGGFVADLFDLVFCCFKGELAAFFHRGEVEECGVAV